MKNLSLIFIVFWGPIGCWCQQYNGRIEIVDDTLQKITITNTTQNITTTSDAYGYFSIAAKVNDTISFTSEWTVPKNIIIDKNLLIRLQPVYLSSAATEL